MKKKVLRKKRNIKKETRNETKKNSSRKSYTQRNTVRHQMRMMIAIMTHEMYSLWNLKMMNNILKKKVKWTLKHN
jgi:hypothetical protein